MNFSTMELTISNMMRNTIRIDIIIYLGIFIHGLKFNLIRLVNHKQIYNLNAFDNRTLLR